MQKTSRMYAVMATGAVLGVLIGGYFNSMPVGIAAGVAGAFVVGVALKRVEEMQRKKRAE